MKKIKYLFFVIILVLSFYVTDQIMIYIDNQSPLMKVIKENVNNYNTIPVNAIIEGNTIIPGIKGKEVNKRKSLLKMEEFGVFNETYLVYDKINPKVTLKDNMDKIIIKGNSIKREISLVLEENPLLEDYLNESKIKYNLLTKLNTNLGIEREYINAEAIDKNFSDLNSLLNKKSLNKKLCFLNYSNINYCQKYKHYIVKYTLKSNDRELLSKLNSGDIILITSKTSLETLKLILNEIRKLDLNIVYLSKLISE